MQPAFAFEQVRLNEEAAARFEASKAELRQQIVDRQRRTRILRERQTRKTAEKQAKDVRKWARDAKSKSKTDRDSLWASCGINLYNGGTWARCFRCDQPLVYTDMHTATTTGHRECPGRLTGHPHTPDPAGQAENTSSPPDPPLTCSQDTHTA